MSQSEQVREAAQRVYVAALGRAHAVEAYGDRETPGASHSLDFAHDQWAEALDGYVAARTAAGSAQSTTDPSPYGGGRGRGRGRPTATSTTGRGAANPAAYCPATERT